MRHIVILLGLAATACTARPGARSGDGEGNRFGLRGDVLPAPLAGVVSGIFLALSPRHRR